MPRVPTGTHAQISRIPRETYGESAAGTHGIPWDLKESIPVSRRMFGYGLQEVVYQIRQISVHPACM